VGAVLPHAAERHRVPQVPSWRIRPAAGHIYMDASLTRKRTPLGPYRRPMPRVLGGCHLVPQLLILDPESGGAELSDAPGALRDGLRNGPPSTRDPIDPTPVHPPPQTLHCQP